MEPRSPALQASVGISDANVTGDSFEREMVVETSFFVTKPRDPAAVLWFS